MGESITVFGVELRPTGRVGQYANAGMFPLHIVAHPGTCVSVYGECVSCTCFTGADDTEEAWLAYADVHAPTLAAQVRDLMARKAET